MRSLHATSTPIFILLRNAVTAMGDSNNEQAVDETNALCGLQRTSTPPASSPASTSAAPPFTLFPTLSTTKQNIPPNSDPETEDFSQQHYFVSGCLRGYWQYEMDYGATNACIDDCAGD